MKEFILEEDKLIPKAKYKEYIDLMLKYDFMPHDIENEKEFGVVLTLILTMLEEYPNFIPAYETAITMVDQLEGNEDILEDLHFNWSNTCFELANKENIWDKEVLWGWQENRPFVRGLIEIGVRLWDNGEEVEAQQFFSRLLKTNEEDYAGIRHYILAIEQGMTSMEYEMKFAHSEHEGYLDHSKLNKWFESGKSKVKELINY